MRINKQDTQGTKPLLGKGELGYDDYTAGGDTGRVYVGTSTENIPLAKRLEANAMTKAQFNALAEERKANRAGSGFDEFGKHMGTSINEGMYANPIYINNFRIGRPLDGTGTSKKNNPVVNIKGVVQNINYINTTINYDNIILLPTAPNIYPYDTVLTAEQIASGVIKHADASNSGLIVNGKFDTDTSGWNTDGNAILSFDTNRLKITNTTTNYGKAYQNIATTIGKEYIFEGDFPIGYARLQIQNFSTSASLIGGDVNPQTGRYNIKFTATSLVTKIQVYVTSLIIGEHTYIDNIAVYPADAISRSDLSFLESWYEDISEKNFVYPLGNVQYLGGNTDGLTGIANGAFTGFETYSLFGNWQSQSGLIGKGYIWSSLAEAQKKAFIANPENNCYLDGDKVIQVRYRIRVLIGEDSNSMAKATVQGKAVVPSTVLFTSPVTTVDAGLYSNTSATYTYTGTNTSAISIATISRRNQGMYHPVHNANGTKKASDNNFWYNTAVSFTSISDCFDPAKLLTNSGSIASAVSGRPD